MIKAGDTVKDSRGVLAKVNWVDPESDTAGVTYTHPPLYAGGTNVVRLSALLKEELDLSTIPIDVLREAVATLRGDRAVRPVPQKKRKGTEPKKLSALAERLLREAEKQLEKGPTKNVGGGAQ